MRIVFALFIAGIIALSLAQPIAIGHLSETKVKSHYISKDIDIIANVTDMAAIHDFQVYEYHVPGGTLYITVTRDSVSTVFAKAD